MSHRENSSETHRIFLLFVFVVSIFLFLFYGLFKCQIVQHDYYTQKEKYQNQRRIVIPAPRGNIFDRNGKLLVCNRPSFDLQIDFNDIRKEIRASYFQLLRENKNKENRRKLQQKSRAQVVQKYLDLASRILNRKIDLDLKKLERHYREQLLIPFTLISNLNDYDYAKLIDELPIHSPLYIVTNYFRFYPFSSAACHVLGYVVSTNEELKEDVPSLRTFQQIGKVGKTGIELSLNEYLSGENGEDIFSVDPSGFRAEKLKSTFPVKGKDCYLSLDIDLQIAAEKTLGPKKGNVTVVDVNTGEVLVMASKPDYDVNALNPRISNEIYKEINEAGAWLNRNIQGTYPPASTFKILSTIAFLRNGVSTWDKNDTIECIGRTQIGPRVFKCDHSTAHGIVNLETALKKSCNVYFYLRSQICGIEKLHQEAQRFHLDEKTGIELPFETTRMLIPDAQWKTSRGLGKWFVGDTANVAIGQGYVLVSPLQMACFTAGIAKNQCLVKPTILHNEQRTPDPSDSIGLRDKDYKNLISTLQQVVETGTGRLAKLDTTSCAGKSGTAQVWEHGIRKNVAWFIGFAPVDSPQIAIAVTVQENSPQDNYYGGKTAAPIAKKVMDFYFKNAMNHH